MVPGQTKEGMDSASIRSVMGGILACGIWMNFVMGRLAGPVFSTIIILGVVATAVVAGKFSVDFRHNKPNEIQGFATLALSWCALACSVALVLWSLYQSFTNPTLSVIITLISGIAICSAPVAVLWFRVRSHVPQKVKTGVAERRENEGPHQ